jgi:hypothetical protein
MQEVEAQRSSLPHDTAHPLYRIGRSPVFDQEMTRNLADRVALNGNTNFTQS